MDSTSKKEFLVLLLVMVISLTFVSAFIPKNVFGPLRDGGGMFYTQTQYRETLQGAGNKTCVDESKTGGEISRQNCGTHVITPVNTDSASSIDLSVETVDSLGNPERVFKSGEDVYIRAVVRNLGSSKISGRLKFFVLDENKVVDSIPSVWISIKPGEQKVVYTEWNSKNLSRWLSDGGFIFVGKGFSIYMKLRTDKIHSSSFDFYVDEFGVSKDFRKLNYYSVGYWWEDIWDKIQERINNGENVRTVWRDEWTSVAEYAKRIGTNVFSIGMHWYSYGDDEACRDACICEGNRKAFSYWFPASEDGNNYYSTPPMYPSVLRHNFRDLGISNVSDARDMIREISDIAHARGMKVAVYLDPIGIYKPDHDFGCNLSYNEYFDNMGWVDRNESGDIRRLRFCESLLDVASDDYGIVASPTGNSSTGFADEDLGFSPSIIDSDLDSGENWDDVSFHYHIAKQFRWLVKNYDFDIFKVDDTGRLVMGCGPRFGSLKFGSDERCLTIFSHLAVPSNRLNPFGPYKGPVSQSLKKHLENKYKMAISDDNFTLDAYANMLRHIRWQLKDAGEDKALVSSDYLVPWPSLVASEDISSTDQFPSDIGKSYLNKGCHILWSEQTYDEGFKPMRAAHYMDPVNAFHIHPLTWVRRDPRVVNGWTWSNRGINLFDYEKLSPYETRDEAAEDLVNYLRMYNQHTEIFSDPNLNLDSVGRISESLQELQKNGRYPDYPSIYPSAEFGLETQLIECYRKSHPVYASSTDEEVREAMIKELAESPENKSLVELIREDMYQRHPEVYKDPNMKLDQVKNLGAPDTAEVGVLTYSSPQRPSGKRFVIHAVQQDLLGGVLGNFYLVPVLVRLPQDTKTDQVRIKLITGDLYNGSIETDLTNTSLWYRCDPNGNPDQDGDYISIDIPTKVYSVVVADVHSFTATTTSLTTTTSTSTTQLSNP